MDTFTALDEYLTGVDARIDRFGFTVQHVAGCDGEEPWSYTIGLVAHGHPEFAVSALCVQSASVALSSLASRVIDGGTFRVGAEAEVLGLTLRLVAVHPGHWEEERFAVWKMYYEMTGRSMRPRALQIMPVAQSWPTADRDKARSWSRHQERFDLPPPPVHGMRRIA